MASATESMQRNPFLSSSGLHKSIPILPSSSARMSPVPPSDPMDISPTATMPPPVLSSPVTERIATSQPTTNGEDALVNGTSSGTVGAAAAAQQPKVVQTAFIHKLYNMLEDQSIQHLISWSSSNDSFVMSPSTEFSKVLSSYFKHTNISSFVRQLNMYGFHKVSDVFHTGAPDSPLWEFKHGNGNFKRGDLVGLREIKRRASRHALIHRESFSTGPKTSVPEVPTPGEPVPHTLEARLNILEHNYFDLHARLARAEDQAVSWSNKCQMLSDGLLRCHQWNQDLATYMMQMVSDSENPIHKDIQMMQREIARQTDLLRTYDEPQPLPSAREQYFSGLNDNGPPLSPRQMPSNERRPSQPSLLTEPRHATFRPPVPPHLSISPRRYGSISGASNSYSPNAARTPAQPPPPPPPTATQHPLATVSSPPINLSRRHTSADIRLHGWQGGPPGQGGGPPPRSHSPYASGQNSTQWPSSPHRTPIGGDQQLRDALASYELPRGPAKPRSRQPTPPTDPTMPAPPPSQSSFPQEPGWQLPAARFPFKGIDTPGPPTRRSSMASNVHSLLNPAATAEEDEIGPEDRKRKRMQ